MFNDEIRTVEISDTHKTLSFTGKCNMCGKCCITLMENPRLLNDKKECKYLMNEDAQKRRLCCIHKAISKNDKKYMKTVPQEDIDYWNSECLDFPKADDSTRCWEEYIIKTGRYPPAGCGYTVSMR